jgi:hypothetical protein
MIWYMGSAGETLVGSGSGLTEELIQLLDDRLLRTVVAGLGEPLVVFKAGIGVGASVWVTVQPLAAAETRTLKRSVAGPRPGRHAMSCRFRGATAAWPAVKSSHELFSYLTECVYTALPQ